MADLYDILLAFRPIVFSDEHSCLALLCDQEVVPFLPNQLLIAAPCDKGHTEPQEDCVCGIRSYTDLQASISYLEDPKNILGVFQVIGPAFWDCNILRSAKLYYWGGIYKNSTSIIHSWESYNGVDYNDLNHAMNHVYDTWRKYGIDQLVRGFNRQK